MTRADLVIPYLKAHSGEIMSSSDIAAAVGHTEQCWMHGVLTKLAKYGYCEEVGYRKGPKGGRITLWRSLA